MERESVHGAIKHCTCISLGEWSGSGINGLEPAVASPPVAPQQQGKMGRCYATSGRQQPTRRLHAPSIFPQLKEADAAHAPRACRAARKLAARLDTFVLWLDRCRPGGRGESARAVKNVPAERPQQGLRTRRGVAANKRITPTKPATREPGERIGREKDGEKETINCDVFGCLFFFLLVDNPNPASSPTGRSYAEL